MAIQQSIVSCGFLFLQRLVNLYGESMIASYTVATRMENILMTRFSACRTPWRPSRARIWARSGPTASPGALAGRAGIAFHDACALPVPDLRHFAHHPRVPAGRGRCGHLPPASVSSAVAIPFSGLFSRQRDVPAWARASTHVLSLLALGLRVIFAYALHNTALFGYTAVWWSQAMAWTVTLLVCYAHVFRGKWKTKSLIS